MSKGIQIILKCLAIVLAISMLGTYVWLRQRASAEVVESSTLESGDPKSNTAEGYTFEMKDGFPVTPPRPDMFDTSKSGKIDATVFSSSKIGIIDMKDVVTLESLNTGEDADPFTTSEIKLKEGGSVTLMPGSKSINMPIFNTKDVTNAITPWDGRTKEETEPGDTKKEQSRIDELIKEAEGGDDSK